MLILTVILAAIALTASIIEIINYVKDKDVKKFKILAFILVFSGFASYMSLLEVEKTHAKELDSLNKEYDKQLLKFENDFIKKDAKVTLESLNYLNNSELSEAIGDLSQIVGFYGRHKDLYGEEYESFKKSKATFESIFEKKIKEGDYFTTDEKRQINSIVTSGKKNLKAIVDDKN